MFSRVSHCPFQAHTSFTVSNLAYTGCRSPTIGAAIPVLPLPSLSPGHDRLWSTRRACGWRCERRRAGGFPIGSQYADRIDTQDYPMMVARPMAEWRLDGLAVRLVQRRVVDHHTALDQRTTVLLLLPQGDSICVPPCGCRHRVLDIRVGRQMESRCVSVAENVLRCDQNLDIV